MGKKEVRSLIYTRGGFGVKKISKRAIKKTMTTFIKQLKDEVRKALEWEKKK
jgi:hypothetical protein